MANGESRTLTIVALGDSTTAGTPGFLSPREAPPDGRGDVTSQYAYWLMQAHPEWKIVNQGIKGQRSDEINARFDADVTAHVPDAVVIVAGVNDVFEGLSAAHVQEHLAAMYAKAANAAIPVVAGSIIPYDIATPAQNACMREINAWIERQAHARASIVFVDTRGAVAAADDPDRLASSPDGLHPDACGYRRMADVIAPAIERLLAVRTRT